MGTAIEARMVQVGSKTPVWVSTAGSGVSWLSIRLDSRPKYYHHSAYNSPDYGLQPHSEIITSSSDGEAEAEGKGSLGRTIGQKPKFTSKVNLMAYFWPVMTITLCS